MTLPVWVQVPDNRPLVAVTLDITFNPNVVAFEACQTNQSVFNLSLCALEEGNEGQQNKVSITALSVNGVSGERLLAEITFTGQASGIKPIKQSHPCPHAVLHTRPGSSRLPASKEQPQNDYRRRIRTIRP